MAAQSHKQQRAISVGGQMGGGFAVTNDISPKHEDMDLPLESVIQDKELSQELHKVCGIIQLLLLNETGSTSRLAVEFIFSPSLVSW